MRTRFVTSGNVPARRGLTMLAAALAIAVVGIPAAWSQAATGTAPAAQSSVCQKAKSKVARDQRAIDKVQHAIDRARAGSTTCTTKPVCDRYATKIEELEARRARRATVLARDQAAAEAACRAS